MSKCKYGTEKQGNLVAVIDYSKKEKVFSKVLTKKAMELYEGTGYLPEGVTVTEQYVVVEHFPTLNEANNFIKAGCKKKPDNHYGIFKSKAQYQLAKKLVTA